MSFSIESLKNVTKYPLIYPAIIETRNFTNNSNLSYYRPDDDKKDFGVVVTPGNKESLSASIFLMANTGYVGEMNLEQNLGGDLALENPILDIPLF